VVLGDHTDSPPPLSIPTLGIKVGPLGRILTIGRKIMENNYLYRNIIA
jgi:hypothetical protein